MENFILYLPFITCIFLFVFSPVIDYLLKKNNIYLYVFKSDLVDEKFIRLTARDFLIIYLLLIFFDSISLEKDNVAVENIRWAVKYFYILLFSYISYILMKLATHKN